MFNSLKYAKQLIEAGFSREQAEAQMQIMADLLESKLAMKDDVEKLRLDMNHRFELVDKRFDSFQSQMDSRFDKVDSKFNEMEAKFDAKLARLETRLFRNLTAMMAILLTAAVALNKFI